MAPQVLSSDSLPGEFFAAGPTTPEGDLSGKVQQRFHELRTATVSLLRVIAIGGGLSWVLLLLYSLGSPPDPVVVFFRNLLIALSALLLLAGVMKWDRSYQPLMAVAALTYFALLAVHAVCLVIMGESPLTPLRLGDYSALPAALFVASRPGMPAVLTALTAVSVAAAVNLGTPPGFALLVEVLHALAPVVPFVIVVSRGLNTTRTIDLAASHTYRDALVLARQETLGELETRFLAFIHDHVLTQLSAIWRGTLSPDPQHIIGGINHTGADTLDSLGDMRFTDAVHQISAAVLAEYPDTVVILDRDDIPDARLPATTVAALVDALRQGGANVAKHAPGSSARLSFDLHPDRFSVTLADDGPGFDPTSLSEDRAGIRVSILGRLERTPGTSAKVHSTPGGGGTIHAVWDRHSSQPHGHADMDALPSVYESMGFSDIFRPGPAVVVWLLFVAMSTANDHPRPVLWLLSLIAAAVAAWCLIQHPLERLPDRYTIAACVSIWAFYALAIGENTTDEDTWPFFWAPWVALLLSAYLAMRNRPLAGWTAWIGCMIIGQLFVWAGFQSDYINPAESWIHSLVLIPASILPWMVKRISDGLPLLITERRTNAATAAVELTRRRFLADARDWLSTRITMLFTDTLTPDETRVAAHLMEQRLRDSIRSPALDRTTISAATWDARLRGVRVKLLDDYSTTHTTHHRGSEPHPRITEVDDTLTRVLRHATAGDTVVARLLPAGRDVSATILHRRQDTGDSETIRI
ncbi:hypothetical protein HMPREF0290_0650 [Corynebacterium efficiens YS-314]|uniref:Histidine kinase/HSP90-like ATPase domain-containing protein n=1 Tax=Corynebacterium efficiens (strain DSM 44549 / YS-314 / AJ 12310 / JCM 11189 / NBRC 100395) TaxID=196164 RepID=Q8FQ53_COREF|nr:ATP-binding protein [Corynebacterium efficiens]EEW50759.1 hypothetical protein HMPREF0290_0650 [Corynebacterium efficiens YS-314]BAC18091.1 hypothetical protein [Corynebacterium efficiens YS-314]